LSASSELSQYIPFGPKSSNEVLYDLTSVIPDGKDRLHLTTSPQVHKSDQNTHCIDQLPDTNNLPQDMNTSLAHRLAAQVISYLDLLAIRALSWINILFFPSFTSLLLQASHQNSNLFDSKSISLSLLHFQSARV
jgi:hypothetical protein